MTAESNTARPASICGHEVTIGRFAIRSIEIRECAEECEADEAGSCWYRGRPDGQFHLFFSVVDVESGVATVTECLQTVPSAVAGDRVLLAAFIRAEIVKGLTHEVDEWLSVDGERCRDPHFPSGSSLLTSAQNEARRQRQAAATLADRALAQGRHTVSAREYSSEVWP